MHEVQTCGLLLPMFRGLCVSVEHTISCEKMAEPIKMPFRLWTRVGPRNRLLGEDPDPSGDGAFGGRLPAMQPFVKILSACLKIKHHEVP